MLFKIYVSVFVDMEYYPPSSMGARKEHIRPLLGRLFNDTKQINSVFQVKSTITDVPPCLNHQLHVEICCFQLY